MNETDFPDALRRCDGDVELLATTAAMVSEDAPIELQRLNDALQNDDASKARASAHALKGMLATFEESAAVTGLKQVEKAAADEALASARLYLETVRADIDVLIAKITAAC